MSPAMIRLVIRYGFEFVKMAMRTGMTAAAVKEPRETNFHLATTPKKTPASINAAKGIMPR